MADSDTKADTKKGTPKKAGGRSKGTPNKQRVDAHAVPAACPKCGSTKRPRYHGSPREIAGDVRHPETGEMFTRKLVRRSECLNCGQHRFDHEYLRE